MYASTNSTELDPCSPSFYWKWDLSNITNILHLWRNCLWSTKAFLWSVILNKEQIAFYRKSCINEIQACRKIIQMWTEMLYYCSKDECHAACPVSDVGILTENVGKIWSWTEDLMVKQASWVKWLWLLSVDKLEILTQLDISFELDL